MKVKAIGFILMAYLIGTASIADAKEPMDLLKTSVDQIVDILQDPQFKNNKNREIQEKKLSNVIDDLFHFGLIAQGTIDRYNWQKFTPEQRSEFIDLFSEFISNVYFNKIQGDYSDVKVHYVEQVMRSDTSAMVKTLVTRENDEIPIDYSMKKLDGKWWVYNVYVEGPSLLGNYRDEHKRLLMKGSYDLLIQELKKKIAEQKKK